jgi:hypothetical protein
MEKEILDIVKDISQWQGDVYKLAALVSDKQRELDEAKAAPPEE